MPHIALDIRDEGAGEPHQRDRDDACEGASPRSEAGGDAALALELEVLRSEELAAGGAEDQARSDPRTLWFHPVDEKTGRAVLRNLFLSVCLSFGKFCAAGHAPPAAASHNGPQSLRRL